MHNPNFDMTLDELNKTDIFNEFSQGLTDNYK